jgi:hypothetical protein
MINRCYHPSCNGYQHYGAKGVTVCERWRNSADNFLFDMGPRPQGKQIDRIDNSKGYEPSNCKWSTMQEQIANRRRGKKKKAFITFNGVTLDIAEWAKELGYTNYRSLYNALSNFRGPLPVRLEALLTRKELSQ